MAAMAVGSSGRKDNSQDEQRQADQDVVLEAVDQEQQERRRRGVEGLEKRGGEGAVINDGRAHGHADAGGRVNAPVPLAAAEPIEIFGMAADEEGFGFAVTVLLFEVVVNGGAAVMPDEARGREAQGVALLLETPADIDVVAGFAENGIETANLLKRPFVESHVAAGDVFGHAVGEHDVRRAAGRDHDGGSDPGIFRRQKIVAANTGEFAVEQAADEIVEPVFVGAAVGVGEGDDFALGGGDAGVSGDGEALVFVVAKVAKIIKAATDLRGAIGGTVVHEDDFVLGIIKFLERLEAEFQRALAVVTCDHDRNGRVAEQAKMRRVDELALDDVKGSFGRAIRSGEAESPVGDEGAFLEPIVGERVNDSAREATAKAEFDLPGKDFAFGFLAFAEAVDAEFAEDEWLRIREHLQAAQVVFERLGIVEVNVVAKEIDVLGFEEFGGWVIAEGAKAGGIDRFHGFDQFFKELTDFGGAAPADDVRWDFIDDADGEDGRMARARFGGLAHGGERFFAGFVRIEETEVLVPGNIDEDAQAMIECEIEEPNGRSVIDPKGICAKLGQHPKVARGLFHGGEEFALAVGRERPIGDAFDVEFTPVQAKEFTVNLDARFVCS
jgi:hypothetical protein